MLGQGVPMKAELTEKFPVFQNQAEFMKHWKDQQDKEVETYSSS